MGGNRKKDTMSTVSIERFKLIPSVYLLLIAGSKILLSRRYNTGYCDGQYGLPAGHLEENETLKQGLVREAKEEIGVALDSADLELVHTMHRKIPNDGRVDFFFTAKKHQGEPKIMEIDKCDDLSWFEFNNLPENTIPYIRQAFAAFLKNIIYSEWEE